MVFQLYIFLSTTAIGHFPIISGFLFCEMPIQIFCSFSIEHIFFLFLDFEQFMFYMSLITSSTSKMDLRKSNIKIQRNRADK